MGSTHGRLFCFLRRRLHLGPDLEATVGTPSFVATCSAMDNTSEAQPQPQVNNITSNYRYTDRVLNISTFWTGGTMVNNWTILSHTYCHNITENEYILSLSKTTCWERAIQGFQSVVDWNYMQFHCTLLCTYFKYF